MRQPDCWVLRYTSNVGERAFDGRLELVILGQFHPQKLKMVNAFLIRNQRSLLKRK